MACVLIAPRVLLLGPAHKLRKRTNFATRERTPNKRRGAAFLERHRPGGAGIICAKNLGRRVVATGGVRIRRSIMDPLTRLAPADEGAGCDPPSPPRGRGRGIRRIERFVNVETRGGSGTLPRQRARCPRYKRNCHYISRLSEGWEKIGLQHLFDDAGHGLDGFIKLRGVLAAGFREVFTAAARTFHVSRRLFYDLAGIELGGEVFRHGGDE